jgi:hypothetical protein
MATELASVLVFFAQVASLDAESQNQATRSHAVDPAQQFTISR